MPASGSTSPKRNLSQRGNAGIEKDLLVAPKSPTRNRSKGGPASVRSPGKSPGSASLAEKLNLSSPKKEKKSDVAPVSPKASKIEEAQTPPPSKKKGVATPTQTASSVLALHSPSSRIQINPRVEKVYKLIRAATGTLGGNGTTGAIYGELTMGSMQKVLNLMVDKFDLNAQSRFIDVGSGLGKPNFHAAQDPECRISIGAELERIRWQLAMYNLHKIAPELARGKDPSDKNNFVDGDDIVNREVKLLSGVNFIEADIDDAASMDPFTHIYMYDLGFPPPLQQSIARKFNTSQYAQCLVSYRPPRRVIEEYGYEVEFIDQMSTSMHGSGEGHMAYFYRRTSSAPKLSASEIKEKYKKVLLPARPFMNEKDTNVLCDPLFAACVASAAGDVSDLQAEADKVVDETLNSERPKRERKRNSRLDT